MARRHILITSILAMLIILCGCGKSVSKHNVIALKELTKDQREIVDLLSIPSKQEILLFSYDADAEYKDMDVWVEIYKDGELIEPNAGGISMMDGIDAYNGELAIVITQDPDFQWTFIVRDESTIVSSPSEPNTNYDASFARGYGPMSGSATIEDGKEIILYTSIFSENSIRPIGGQDIAEEPELLRDYPYAHIIKCRFSE